MMAQSESEEYDEAVRYSREQNTRDLDAEHVRTPPASTAAHNDQGASITDDDGSGRMRQKQNQNH
ncbi:hypothetical protein WDJ51_05425 [Rathayibacter sp. YIM 133350]|uniref:hypothetical protein n=1 Tax=Rathayibacter sp. YIM 133350 TaxID=3131992 RepID=UPI00307D6B9C